MRGPVASVTCHEPDRADLVGRLRTAAERAGLEAWATAAAGTDGHLVVLEVPLGDLGLGPVDDGPGWAALSNRLGTVLDEVVPAIALGGFSPVLDLDDPVWRIDRLQWCSGRVDVTRLDLDQVAAFNALVGERMVEVRDGTARWATPPGVPLGVGLLDAPPLPVAAATYEAWTGEEADLEPVPVDVDDANLPVLWLWAPDAIDSLADDVRAALPSYDVGGDDDHGPFSPVVASPPTGRTALPDLLDDLRHVVATARPAWAGLLPRGGFLPPGVSPETPEASLVDHLWLQEDWAGAALDRLTTVLPEIEPERVGDGLLLTTVPEPRSDVSADLLWTPMVRYDRLVEVARVLGERVRESVDGGPTIVI